MSSNSINEAGVAVSNALADAVERAGAVTVLVNARKRLPLSGVLIAADQVLTASHGVEREEDIHLVLANGEERSAVLAGRDRGMDLAVLRLSSPAEGTAGLSAQEPRVGHLVAAVGRPSTEGIQASLGMINAIGSALRTMGGGLLERYLVTDAVPYPGFSGGPLVDLAGGIVGINTSGLVRGTSLAISAKVAWEVARSLAQHGHIRRGFIGIRSQVVELPNQGQALGRQQATGLLVMGIENDGPAAKGGLMVGDILTGLNGQPVADHDDLLTRLTGDVVGKAAEVQVLRGGVPQNVTVMVGERV